MLLTFTSALTLQHAIDGSSDSRRSETRDGELIPFRRLRLPLQIAPLTHYFLLRAG